MKNFHPQFSRETGNFDCNEKWKMCFCLHFNTYICDKELH